MIRIFSLLLLLLSSAIVFSQEKAVPSPIIFIYDASGSMWGQIDGKSKLEIANEVLIDAVGGFADNQQVGLVAYGHRSKTDCKDVETMVDAENKDKVKVIEALNSIKPLGKTPLAYSATQVINYLRDQQMKATIILITDGIEVCGGDLCKVVKAAKEEGIDFRMHIVGFGLKSTETEQLKCAADAGDGTYYDAADANGLGEGINEAANVTIDDPIDNFSVYATKNGAPIDAWASFYVSGESKTVSGCRTFLDTGFISILPGTYDLIVRPLQGSDVDAIIFQDITIKENETGHKDVRFDAGVIGVMTSNNGEGWDAVVGIFSSADGKKVAGGRTYGREDFYELNPGTYDVRVKPMIIQGVETSYEFTEVVVVPNDTVGVSHDFPTGIAMIGATSSTGLVDAVIKIKDKKSGKLVASGRSYTRETNNPKKFVLTPGSYEVSLQGLGDYRSENRTHSLVVKPGETIEHITQF